VRARRPPDDKRTREALLEENARLKEALLERRTHSPMWPVVALLLVHILLRPLMDPWLNASSDTKVYAAVVILAVPIVAAVVMLIRVFTRKS
jgi:hypothetical protein